MPRSPRTILIALTATIAFLGACGGRKASAVSASGGCDQSIKLPTGFCALVFSESAGPARHLVVRKNGDVIVGVLDVRRQVGGLLALRDTNKDGHADIAERFGDAAVHGVLLAGDSVLYASTATSILRYHFLDSLTPRKRIDTVVSGLPERAPPSHSLAMDVRGNLIVNLGAVSNGCASPETPNTRGRDPCPELETTGGIWRFSPDRVNQQLKDGQRIATGLHNAVALAVNPHDTTIYAVSHGRDRLHELWPDVYTEQQAATLPAEEMIRITTVRADFGWPYCYYDYLKQERAAAPEYADDAKQSGRCDHTIQPLIAFPAHWAPMSMLFYTGTMFPAAYRTGVFIAFHGSAFRAPLPEEGYHVVYLTFTRDNLAGDYSIFATNFAGDMMSPEGAAHRAVGLAQGPDGALYLSDDKGGRIWRIIYSAK